MNHDGRKQPGDFGHKHPHRPFATSDFEKTARFFPRLAGHGFQNYWAMSDFQAQFFKLEKPKRAPHQEPSLASSDRLFLLPSPPDESSSFEWASCGLLFLSEYIFAIPAKIVASLSGWGSFASKFPLNKNNRGTIFRFCIIAINSMRDRVASILP